LKDVTTGLVPARKGKDMLAAIDLDAMIKPRKAEPDTMLSIRVPRPLIEAAKDEAAKRGIPYSVLIREAIVKLLKDAA
jgi:predicted DNA binding CopG/RHH family protein